MSETNETAAVAAAVEKPVEIASEKPAAIPAVAAAVEKPIEIPAVDDGSRKVNKEEWEQTTKDAAAFRALQNTEAKLKGKYAKLEFISKWCQNMPRDLCMQLLPDTENEKELYAACDRISASLTEEIRRQVAKGHLAYRNLGGSAGGNAPQAPSNTNLSAGALLGMRR